jgi:hypothetical protein
MQLARTAVWLAGVIAPAAAVAQTVNLPTLDCTVDFVSLQAVVQALPGAERGEEGGFVTVKLAEPDVWRVEYGFTTRWHPAGNPAHLPQAGHWRVDRPEQSLRLWKRGTALRPDGGDEIR